MKGKVVAQVEGKQLLEGELLSVGECAKRLKIGRSKMYAMVDAGEVQHLRIGRTVRIPERALERLAEKCVVGE
jgi:excisionase family DNA binding protein